MGFNKDDMRGSHYNWNDNAIAAGKIYAGEPSRRLFDRFNGDQVLFLVNFYCSILPEGFNLQHARIAEWELTHHLPTGIKSELSVFNWLNESVLQNA